MMLKSNILVFPSPFKSVFVVPFKKFDKIILKSNTLILPSPLMSPRLNEATGAAFVDDVEELLSPDDGTDVAAGAGVEVIAEVAVGFVLAVVTWSVEPTRLTITFC